MIAAIENFLIHILPIHMFFAVQLILAELMFVIREKKRSHPALRISVCLIFYLLISLFHPVMGNKFVRVLCIFGWSILFLYFCLNVKFKRILFIAIASYAIQNLAYNVGDLTVHLLSIDRSFLYYVITAIVFILVYVCCYFIIVRRFAKEDDIFVKDIRCLVLAIATIIVVFGKNAIRSTGIMTDYELLALFTSISCILTLVVQFGAIRQGEIEEKNRVIEKLLLAEKNRQEMLKENIDIINMKCHDLRYHIDEYRQENAGAEHDKFFEEGERSVNFYDSIPITGNSALDVVLFEKLHFCNKNGIEVSYMVDEKAIERMDTSDIYSLFGNAFDNAIESVQNEEKERRIISLSVRKKGNCGQIVLSNYCAKQPSIEDGIPVSEKDANRHGFGMRSIRFIVQKYKGSMLVDFADNMFTLSILLPL